MKVWGTFTRSVTPALKCWHARTGLLTFEYNLSPFSKPISKYLSRYPVRVRLVVYDIQFIFGHMYVIGRNFQMLSYIVSHLWWKRIEPR